MVQEMKLEMFNNFSDKILMYLRTCYHIIELRT